MPSKSVKSVERKSVKKGGKKRKPSAYNLYMKNNLSSYKKDNPTATHQEAFKAIAKKWSDDKK